VTTREAFVRTVDREGVIPYQREDQVFVINTCICERS
jgi:hypothetical protein